MVQRKDRVFSRYTRQNLREERTFTTSPFQKWTDFSSVGLPSCEDNNLHVIPQQKRSDFIDNHLSSCARINGKSAWHLVSFAFKEHSAQHRLWVILHGSTVPLLNDSVPVVFAQA